MSTKNTAGQSAAATPSSIYTDDMFVSDAIIEHPVKLGDGTERTLYFRQLTAVEMKQHFEAERSKDPKIRKESAARLIAKSLVEPDGRRALDPQRAAVLKPAVSGAIFMAILEVNGMLPKRPTAKPEGEPSDDESIEGGEEQIAGEDEAGN